MDINSKIERLIINYDLGSVVNSIEAVTGGLSHRMYKVDTDKGTYAIKELNAGVMKREEAYNNFLFSERVSDLAIENGIPAVGALKINNDIMVKIDDSYFMVFNWQDGKILKPEEITEEHCKIVGELLARIHNIDYSSVDDEKRKVIKTEYYDWNQYIPIAEKQNKPYLDVLKDNVDLLYELNEKAVKALEYAKDNLVISHRDMDRKNIMWNNGKPYIIDWEASGYTNPNVELIEVAWYWSGGDVEKIDYNKFKTLVETYKKYYNGEVDSNIDILVPADLYGGLGWINYNLKRSLCIENSYDEDEIKLAENEVMQSIGELKYNASQFDKMIEILSE